MFNKTTTDLPILRSQPRRHTWGPVTKIHDVGRYSIVEYTCNSNGASNGETHFAVYVDGESLSQSTRSLESALLTAIAYAAYPADRTYAGWMTAAMLRLVSGEKEV
jgi:hypothetical protein